MSLERSRKGDHMPKSKLWERYYMELLVDGHGSLREVLAVAGAKWQ